MFYALDKDGDGQVSFEELTEVMNNASMQEAFPMADMTQLYEKLSGRKTVGTTPMADRNIDFDHFLAALRGSQSSSATGSESESLRMSAVASTMTAVNSMRRINSYRNQGMRRLESEGMKATKSISFIDGADNLQDFGAVKTSKSVTFQASCNSETPMFITPLASTDAGYTADGFSTTTSRTSGLTLPLSQATTPHAGSPHKAPSLGLPIRSRAVTVTPSPPPPTEVAAPQIETKGPALGLPIASREQKAPAALGLPIPARTESAAVAPMGLPIRRRGE